VGPDCWKGWPEGLQVGQDCWKGQPEGLGPAFRCQKGRLKELGSDSDASFPGQTRTSASRSSPGCSEDYT
jgi:hypothetical protein